MNNVQERRDLIEKDYSPSYFEEELEEMKIKAEWRKVKAKQKAKSLIQRVRL